MEHVPSAAATADAKAAVSQVPRAAGVTAAAPAWAQPAAAQPATAAAQPAAAKGKTKTDAKAAVSAKHAQQSFKPAALPSGINI